MGKDNTERRRMTDAADTADRVLRSGRVQPFLFLAMGRRIFHNSFIPPMAWTDRVTVGEDLSDEQEEDSYTTDSSTVTQNAPPHLGQCTNSIVVPPHRPFDLNFREEPYNVGSMWQVTDPRLVVLTRHERFSCAKGEQGFGFRRPKAEGGEGQPLTIVSIATIRHGQLCNKMTR